MNVVTISSWLDFGRPAPLGRGSAGGGGRENYWLHLTTASAQCLRLSERLFIFIWICFRSSNWLCNHERHGSRVYICFPVTILCVTGKEVVGGMMYLACQYNGNDLYSNHWDLCAIEDDDAEDRVINCPIRAGRRKFVKELKIPNYLPKVDLQTNSCATFFSLRVNFLPTIC